jgi:hypothetical protein
MGGNRKSLPGANPKGIKQCCADRANDRARQKYSTPSPESKVFNFDTHERAVRRAIVDAVYLLKDWPTRARFSWYVDRNGCLRCKAERRQAG